MPRTKYRPRKSKFPDTDARFWLKRYSWNGKHRRPTYDGIPDAMHQPIRDLIRERQRTYGPRYIAKRKAIAERKDEATTSIEKQIKMLDAIPTPPPRPEYVPAARMPAAAWLAIAASVLLAVAFTAATADVSRRSAERLSHRIAQLESRLP